MIGEIHKFGTIWIAMVLWLFLVSLNDEVEMVARAYVRSVDHQIEMDSRDE